MMNNRIKELVKEIYARIKFDGLERQELEDYLLETVEKIWNEAHGCGYQDGQSDACTAIRARTAYLAKYE